MTTKSNPQQQNGVTRTERHGETEPSLPHEHDESRDGQPRDSTRDPVERAAHEDVRKGREDTDRGPAVDKTYRRLKDA